MTAEQLKWGYLVWSGVVARHHEYEVIRKLDDGTYLVREPEVIE